MAGVPQTAVAIDLPRQASVRSACCDGGLFLVALGPLEGAPRKARLDKVHVFVDLKKGKLGFCRSV